MKARSIRKRGVALMLVMIVLSAGAILGMTYLASASVERVESQNLSDAGRAKYLAESGVMHALCLLKDNPSALNAATREHPLGPFYADQSDDPYRFYVEVDPAVPWQYTVVGLGSCRQGQISQSSTITVQRGGGTPVTDGNAMAVDAKPAVIPSCVRVSGGMLVSGNLENHGYIDGLVSYTGTLTSDGTITQTPVRVDSADMPNVQWTHYKDYNLFGSNYDAQKLDLYVLDATDPRANGGSIDPQTNPGGVVWINPPKNTTATLAQNLHFKGTIIVNGNLIIDGGNIVLEPVNGFPALVVNGKILVTDRANADIRGLVVCDKGIAGYTASTPHAVTNIQGGLISPMYGYDKYLKGTHQLTYSTQKCMLFDVNDSLNQSGTVEVLEWKD